MKFSKGNRVSMFPLIFKDREKDGKKFMVETEDRNMKEMINVFINIMKRVFSLSKCKSKFNSRISRGDTLDILRKLDH